MRARMDAAQARACNPHAQGWAITARLADVLRSLQGTTVRPKELLAKRNKDFVESELLRWRSFFDHCEERPLTDEQARAAITFEENTLLVAAAGSGKTSTVVGKVAYALVKGIARPEEILCLAFNKKAAEEIGQRVTKRLTDMQNESCPIDPAIKRKLVELVSNGIQIESRTFHSLGLKIIRDVERNKTLVSKEAENKQRVPGAIAGGLLARRFA